MSNIILGSEGMVGRALHREDTSAMGFSHEQLDITNYHDLFSVFDGQRPSVCYMAAANSNVDGCEDMQTNKVNVAGTLLVLRLCEMFNTKMVWFSSSYVFNGMNHQPYMEYYVTDPVQNYGRQKEQVEQAMLKSNTPVLIIRTVGVFGQDKGNRNFVNSVATSVTHRRKVFAPTDQYMNPIYVRDLSVITVGLARKHTGIYHVAGDQCMSKYEYALSVANWFGKDKMVEGVTSGRLKQAAPRPRMGCLDCTEIESLGYAVPNFTVGLSQFLEAEHGAA